VQSLFIPHSTIQFLALSGWQLCRHQAAARLYQKSGCRRHLAKSCFKKSALGQRQLSWILQSHDFLRAEPKFATNAAKADDELRSLVDAAHGAGLYVIFDIVLNHTGDVFAYNGASEASFSAAPMPVQWRAADGTPVPDLLISPPFQILPSTPSYGRPSSKKRVLPVVREPRSKRKRHGRGLSVAETDDDGKFRCPAIFDQGLSICDCPIRC